jgi:large subunit ribosomal protein L9
VEAAAAVGVKVDRGHVQLTAPIKTIGLHQVSVSPHPEVEVLVTVNIARSPEEAAAQARGEDLTGPVSDRAEIRAAAEALFEEAQAEAAAEDNR